MIEGKIKTEIVRRLRRTEEEKGVRILMAIESGSRAWGFASPNSDYDVRFIYSQKKEWYLSVDLEKKRDVIEYPIIDEIDLNGWDIRKALMLFGKSNPAFIEWIKSPITYINRGSFREDAIKILPEIYSVTRGIYHYRSMAKTNYREYLKAETVPLKKYFYVLRPLFAIKWLEKYGEAPPIEFHKLLELVTNKKLLKATHELLEKKKISEEKMMAPAIPVLNNYIESELSKFDKINSAELKKESTTTLLNNLFHKVLNEKVI